MGNLRIPRMRITALHVEGILRALDERAAKRPAPKAPTLRYPQDFPGARATGACRSCGEGELPLPEQNICPPCQLQADTQTVAEHGNDADVMIEIDAQHEEARAAMIESAIALDEADGVDSWDADVTHYTADEVVEQRAEQAAVLPAVLATLDPTGRAALAEPAEENVVIIPLPGTSLAEGKLPPDPIAARRARLESAISWLKRERCILVTVADRDHAIRAYRITGRRGVFLAEEVIEEARRQGYDG